jgi:ABC-2 type transport system permease protein
VTLGGETRKRRSAFSELVVANALDLARSGKTIFGVLFMFVFLLAIVATIHFSINVQRPAPVVAISGNSSQTEQLARALDRDGIEVVESSRSQQATAVVVLRGDSASVTVDYPHPPAFLELSRAIESLGYAPGNVLVERVNGVREVDILRVNLGALLIAGLLAIAFLGTSVPIASLRRRGTLRLFGTTPVSRLAFIVAQTPVRFFIGIVEAGIIVAISAANGYADSFNIARLSVTLLIGLAMLFSLAYLLASKSSNPDTIGQISGLIPVLVVLTSGTLLPTQGFPKFVIIAMNSFPTTWFMQAVSADVSGTEPFVGVYALWAMMLAVTAVGGLIAAKVFRWNQAETA